MTRARSAACVLLCAAWAAAVCAPARPARADGTAVTVNGRSVTVEGAAGGFKVLVDGAPVIQDKDDVGVLIQGAYEGGGRFYALIAEASGGNACAAQFQAIDVTPPGPAVSPVFGTCSDLPDVAVVDGALHVTMPRMDGLSRDEFVFKDGKLTSRVRPIDLTPRGPATAPGGDLAALADGQYAFDLIKLAAVADPLRRIMGAAAFADARRLAVGGASTPGELRGDLAVVEACQAHACPTHRTKWVFDRHGHVAASLTRAGRTRVFGRPTPEMRALLTG